MWEEALHVCFPQSENVIGGITSTKQWRCIQQNQKQEENHEHLFIGSENKWMNRNDDTIWAQYFCKKKKSNPSFPPFSVFIGLPQILWHGHKIRNMLPWLSQWIKRKQIFRESLVQLDAIPWYVIPMTCSWQRRYMPQSGVGPGGGPAHLHVQVWGEFLLGRCQALMWAFPAGWLN